MLADVHLYIAWWAHIATDFRLFLQRENKKQTHRPREQSKRPINEDGFVCTFVCGAFSHIRSQQPARIYRLDSENIYVSWQTFHYFGFLFIFGDAMHFLVLFLQSLGEENRERGRERERENGKMKISHSLLVVGASCLFPQSGKIDFHWLGAHEVIQHQAKWALHRVVAESFHNSTVLSYCNTSMTSLLLHTQCGQRLHFFSNYLWEWRKFMFSNSLRHTSITSARNAHSQAQPFSTQRKCKNK